MMQQLDVIIECEQAIRKAIHTAFDDWKITLLAPGLIWLNNRIPGDNADTDSIDLPHSYLRASPH